MININFRRTGRALVIFCLTFGFIVLCMQLVILSRSNVKNESVLKDAENNSGIKESESSKEIKGTVSSTSNSVEKITWIASKEQIAELTKWEESRGWYDTSNDTWDDYKSYSRETLKSLADRGDLKALHLLNKGTPVPEKKALLTKAAVYGSTYALVILRHVDIPANDVINQMTDAERKEIVINTAVYPVVAKLRGELEVPRDGEFAALEKTYSVKLTDADKQAITEKAQSIYDDLESQREALGLGKFDNTIPPIARAYYISRGLLK